MIETVRGLASVKVTAERADGDSQVVEHGGTCLQHTVLQIKQIKLNLRLLVNQYPCWTIPRENVTYEALRHYGQNTMNANQEICCDNYRLEFHVNEITNLWAQGQRQRHD
jgi:hypothetical protein